MFRLFIKLAIVALIAHAGVKIVPVFWTYLQFKDALAETARFPGKKTEEELTQRAAVLAKELQVPLNANTITVKRNANSTVIDTSYVAQLEYFPRRYYPWEFKIHVDEAPPRFGDYIP